ncbi:MAG: D-alanyl-D-alanine carboxypeptidase family protein [Blautia sp.]|nr:D-alanyl-D-alanine carboxypeptidase family protein [Blautia sp.]
MRYKKHIPKLLLSIFSLLLFFLTPLSVSAQDFPSGWPSAPEISSASGVLMEASSGQVLFDKSMNEIRYPASTTKVMTTLIILENIQDLNQNITFTDIILPDLAPGNSTINAQVGEVLTVEQCLYAIMLASANEVCTQMAVEIAGSVENFTAMMNTKAAEIGCTNTHFVNANGLPDPNHYTTAYDLALILREAVKNEAFCKIAGAAKYTIPPTNKTSASRNMENHNALLVDGKYYYEGAIAGKTGHTEAARNTLVTAATREDMTLICVVLRSENEERFTDTKTLFDYGFDNFHSQPLYWMDKDIPVGNVILPQTVTTDALSVLDIDENNQRTRTWSYNGTGLYKTSVQLPLSVETQITSDMSMFQTGTIKTVFPSPFILPILLTLTALFAVIMIVLIIKYQIRKRARKTNK